MTQPDLFTATAGPCYDPALDGDRLTKQMGRVYAALAGGDWLSLAELAAVTGDPEASASAQIRHCRKPRFGGHRIDKRRRNGAGTWEYKLVTN